MSFAFLGASLDLSPTLAAPQLRRLPLPGPFGAEIRDIDLAAPLSEGTLAALRTALERDLLLVFRDQQLAPAQQLALTRALGRVQAHPRGTAEVVIEAGRAGDTAWHADLAYAAVPNRLSILQVAEASAAEAAIHFADQRAAYARLDPWLAHEIEYLEVEHDPARTEDGATLPQVVHPVVRVDPATGQRSLFVDSRSAARLLGVPATESKRLLARLRAAATDPGVTWRHAWRPGDVLVWDNLALLHRVEAAPDRRAPRMLRTMVAGERLVGPAATTTAWMIAG